MEIKNFDSVIRSRVNKRIKLAKPHLYEGQFYIGGSSIYSRGPITDIDVFPVPNEEFKVPEKSVCKTKNATTVLSNDGTPIQFCNYKHESLKSLVESFDFAHLQVGAHISDTSVISVYYTEKFVESKVCENSEFTGSEYPLSSLVRLFKYNERKYFSRSALIRAVFDIVLAINVRGFKSYEDFKDQLDAVDLGVVPADLSDLDIESLRKLFEVLKKNE